MARQPRINLSLTADLYRMVQIECEDTGRSEQDVIRDRLRLGFDADDKTGIGEIARELISKGQTNAQVLEAILKRKPSARTTLESVQWYRSKMRANGLDIMTNLEAIEADST